jgi:replicative DNA helicase
MSGKRDLTPHNLEAERSVLGGVLVNNDQLEHVRDFLTAHDFFRGPHKVIWAGILEVVRRDMAADLVTLVDHLRQSGQLESAEGPAYIASLVDGVPLSVNVPYYARVLRAHTTRREIIATALRLIEAAQVTDTEAAELIDVAESQLTAIGTQQTTDLAAGEALSRDAMRWLEEVAAQRSHGRMSGVPSGLPDLDAMTDGFQPGDLVVIGARPSQGKTALALQLALACEGNTAFFSLEMRRAQLAARALAWLARVDGWALRRGLLRQDEYGRVSRALTSLADSGLAIDDASDLTVWQIRSKARRWKAQHGLALVIVDYLQLVTPARDKRKQTTREQEVATMSRSLKGLAKDVSVPVIVLAQLNRAVEGRADAVPKLADLRESGAVEQDADLVLFLHRPNGKSVKDEGEAHIIVAKHRNGPTGTVPVWWLPSQTRFAPLAQAEAVRS